MLHDPISFRIDKLSSGLHIQLLHDVREWLFIHTDCNLLFFFIFHIFCVLHTLIQMAFTFKCIFLCLLKHKTYFSFLTENVLVCQQLGIKTCIYYLPYLQQFSQVIITMYLHCQPACSSCIKLVTIKWKARCCDVINTMPRQYKWYRNHWVFSRQWCRGVVLDLVSHHHASQLGLVAFCR